MAPDTSVYALQPLYERWEFDRHKEESLFGSLPEEKIAEFWDFFEEKYLCRDSRFLRVGFD